jgi:hypothetical protein
MTEPGPEPGREYYPAEPPTEHQPQPDFSPATEYIQQPTAARDRRTWWWVGGGIGVLVVVGLIVGIALSGGSSSPPAAGPAPIVAPSSSTGGAPATTGKNGKAAKGAGGVRVGAGISALQGPVTSVGDGKLTITPEGLPAVSVTTTDSTKVSGGGASSLSDLKPGQPVIVLVKDGTAVTVRVRGKGAGKQGNGKGSTTPTG